MEHIYRQFALDGLPISCARYGSGHINETYLLVTSRPHLYILQKINSYVFHNAAGLMDNIIAVTGALRRQDSDPRHVLTLVPMLVAVCVGLFVFKTNILDLLGTITGGMTSTPGLAAVDSMTDSNIPSVAYATVYPIAMVFLILIIQVIASAVY